MNRYVTKGIVLSRTNFGEADRIITFLTPTRGKVRAMAKGVRKLKSKLAAGVELFSVSDLTIMVGKGEIHTLMSARLDRHYEQIVKDTERTNLAYELINLTEKATEDDSDSGYFDLLNQIFIALNDQNISPAVIRIWYQLHLLDLAGHTPDLKKSNAGQPLDQTKAYDFDLDRMAFTPKEQGAYGVNEIKFLRLAFSAAHPQNLARVNGADRLASGLESLMQPLLKNFFRI